MKNNWLNEISLKHLKRKENIIYGLIIVFLILIIYIALTIINFSINYRLDTYKYNFLARTILVSGLDSKDTFTRKKEEELNNLSNLKHVELNVSEVYYNPSYQQIKDFDIDNLPGEIQIRAILNDKTIKIVNGKMPKNDNEIVVPVSFYPHGQGVIDNKKILIGKDLIGKEITLYSEKGYYSVTDEAFSKQWKKNRKSINAKIVGTYNPEYGMYEKNTCFGTKKLIEQLKDDYGSSQVNIVAGKEPQVTYMEYGRMLIVDKYKNVKDVAEYLENNNFEYSIAMIFDELEYGLILIIPLIISIIIIVITITLIKNFINKKYKNNHEYLGLLRTLGYNETQIKKIMLYENIYVVLISTIIAFVLYLITFIIVKNVSSIFSYVDYFSVTIRKPYLYIIILTILLLYYVYLVNKKISQKYISQNISDLLRDE